MSKFLGYKCSQCGQEFRPDEVMYLCPKDGGVLNVAMDYATIQKSTKNSDIQASRDFSMWRYLPMLPVKDPGYKNTPYRSVGWTKVYAPKKLARKLNLRQLWIKDESSNPTASLKDRGSATVIARAKEIMAAVIVTASTGNAGAALAGLAAAAEISAVIFAPKNAPAPKVAQLLVYGAQVILVDGSYDDAVELSRKSAAEFGWYCRNTGFNPFTAEGKKTAAFEIWEQVIAVEKLERDLCVFVSVGDGNIMAGLHKGFIDLVALGWLEQMPRLFGIQAKGSASIANAFEYGTEDIQAVEAKTLADSISVNLPNDGLRALRAAKQTNGSYLTVGDDAILASIAELGHYGIFSEPAAAAAFAGLRKAVESGLIGAGDPVLVLNTGSGLKDVNAARQSVAEAPVVKPTMDAVRRALEVLH